MENDAVRVPMASGSREPDQQAVPALSGFDPSRCANCEGSGWVCENHPDRPWEGATAPGEGCGCGAGAPCPVCQHEMSCAPYAVQWTKGMPRLTDEMALVVFVPTEANRTYRSQPYQPVVTPAYFDENGIVCDPGTWAPDPGIRAGKWDVAAWTRMPEPPAWLRDSDGSGEADETRSGSAAGDSAGRQASPDTQVSETPSDTGEKA